MNESLKAALLRKQSGNPPPLKPKEYLGTIQYAKAGTHIATDGKTYTITPEESQDVIP